MKILEITQGTKEWHDFRRSHLGASEAGIIMGMNPYRSPLELWEEKVLGWEQEKNQAMTDGQIMEPIARAAYEKLVGFLVVPMVAEHDTIPYLSASFDGLTVNLTHAVEIKCGKGSHRSAMTGQIPAYYQCQLQHQMMIADLSMIDYYSFDGKEGILIEVVRDNSLISEMLERYEEFWHHIQTETPPRQYGTTKNYGIPTTLPF